MRSRYIYPALIGLLTSLILIIYIIPLIDFSMANPYWNGYSDLTKLIDAKPMNSPLTELSIYPPSKTCIIIIPYEEYSADELSRLKDFISLGGTAIILSDYGYGNMILRYLDAPVMINSSGMLIDPLFHYKSSRLPEINRFDGEAVSLNISSIVFNHASILEVEGSDVEILAWSSPFSYFDLDLDSKYDDGEPVGPFPVLAEFSIGLGKVYVISDPSILLNSMVDLGGNLKLIRGLAGDREILLDQYHLKTNIHYIVRMQLINIYKRVSNIYLLSALSMFLITSTSYYIIKNIWGVNEV